MSFADVRVIGFDLDQTLYPKSSRIDDAIQEYLHGKIVERLAVSRDEAADRFNALYQGGKGLSGSKSLVALGFAAGEASDAVQEALERANIDEFLVPNAQTIAFLGRCAERFTAVDLITGSTRSMMERKLAKMQIPVTMFHVVIAGDDASKSDGAAYRLWLDAYPNLTPSEFLYVGDRPSSDYEAPKVLGIPSVLVNVANANADCPQYPSIADFDRALFGR